MNKLILMTSVAAFSVVSGLASAATLKNTDKDTASVTVEMGGKKETVSIKSGDSYDSKGKDASFILGKHHPVLAKAGDKLMIKNGKIEAETADTSTKAVTPAPEAAKPVEKTTAPASKPADVQ